MIADVVLKEVGVTAVVQVCTNPIILLDSSRRFCQSHDAL